MELSYYNFSWNLIHYTKIIFVLFITSIINKCKLNDKKLNLLNLLKNKILFYFNKFNLAMSVDFSDLSSFIDSSNYTPIVDNLHYCQWIYYNTTRPDVNEIIQIEFMKDRRTFNLTIGREVNNPLFKDWGFDMNFYNECGKGRFCNSYHVKN